MGVLTAENKADEDYLGGPIEATASIRGLSLLAPVFFDSCGGRVCGNRETLPGMGDYLRGGGHWPGNRCIPIPVYPLLSLQGGYKTDEMHVFVGSAQILQAQARAFEHLRKGRAVYRRYDLGLFPRLLVAPGTHLIYPLWTFPHCLVSHGLSL